MGIDKSQLAAPGIAKRDASQSFLPFRTSRFPITLDSYNHRSNMIAMIQDSGLDMAVAVVVGFGLLAYYLIANLTKSTLHHVRAPSVGHRSIFEPSWLVRLRFIRGGRAMISQGYEQYGNGMFKLRRIGADVLVISNSRVDEIRALSGDKTRSVEPFIKDFAGDYTDGMVFLHSDLQNRVVQQKLTPNLAALTIVMGEELEIAFEKEIPKCQGEWVQVDIVPMFSRIISRISARIFLGPEECHDEEWLSTTTEYTKNLFITGMALRMFPPFLRPLVAPMLPSYRGLKRNVASARRIVDRIIQQREAAGELDPNKSTDILTWMMSMASGEEREIDNLAQRILLLSLSSIHTTALTMAQAIYDLTAHPEFKDPLLAEVLEVLRRDRGWQKSTIHQFRKLDSLLKESQRLNPVFLLTFNRIFHQPMTLSDGTYLPKGTRVAVASHAMLQDSAHVPGPAPPAEFDAFRFSRLREIPEHAQRHLLAMTDNTNMAFGYGKYACPGRFYAANEMKLVLAQLLLRYDFKFLDGCSRPKNFTVDSDMYPDPSARMLMTRNDKFEKDLAEVMGTLASKS